MTGAAQVDPATIRDVARALVRYGEAEERVFALVGHNIRAVMDRVRSEQQRRRSELDRAQDSLRACLRAEDADCSLLHATVRRCQQRVEAADRSSRQVNAAVGRYQPAQARQSGTVQALVSGGRTYLARKSEQIESYLASSSAGGSGGGGAGSARLKLAGQIAKEVALSLGPALALEAMDPGSKLGLSEAKDLVDSVITTARDPVARRMAAEKLHFDDLGDAISKLRHHG